MWDRPVSAHIPGIASQAHGEVHFHFTFESFYLNGQLDRKGFGGI